MGLSTQVIDTLKVCKPLLEQNRDEIGRTFYKKLFEEHPGVRSMFNQTHMMGKDGKPVFLSNHNGGVLGGISTGQDIVVRVAIKPTSSILTPRKSIDRDGQETEVITKGRHDPCVGIRGVPVAQSMLAIVLLDQLMRHHAQTGLLPR